MRSRERWQGESRFAADGKRRRGEDRNRTFVRISTQPSNSLIQTSHQVKWPLATLTLNDCPINLVGGNLIELSNPIARLGLASLEQHGNGCPLRFLKRQGFACLIANASDPTLSRFTRPP